MGFFSDEPRRVRIESSVDLAPQRPPWSLWADGFGKLGIRAVQIIVVVLLAAGIVWGIQQLTLVTIPVTIALIIACALAPVMSWLRRRGVPSVLATILVLLASTVILGLLTWLIVSAVRNQWADLYTQAEQGFQDLIAWVNTLPFAPYQAQLDEWIATATDFVTSSQFGSGALAGAGAVANFVAGLILMITVLFFFLKDGPQIWEFLLRPFRGENYTRARRIGDKTRDDARQLPARHGGGRAGGCRGHRPRPLHPAASRSLCRSRCSSSCSPSSRSSGRPSPASSRRSWRSSPTARSSP